jgi:NADH-quinone oxidoreductase subunit E
LERDLKVRAGDTTEDRRFTLETVNCLGACALGPVVVVDGKYFGKIRQDGVQKVLKDYK